MRRTRTSILFNSYNEAHPAHANDRAELEVGIYADLILSTARAPVGQGDAGPVKCLGCVSPLASLDLVYEGECGIISKGKNEVHGGLYLASAPTTKSSSSPTSTGSSSTRPEV